MTAILERAQSLIRDVPDFPKKGIIFKDITPLLADAEAFDSVIDRLSEPFKGQGITHVAGIESRGFLFSAPVAGRLKAGVVLIRKKGKLPSNVHQVTYDLEYGQDTLEAHKDSFPKGSKVLLIDDVLATGGTAQAACKLLGLMEAEIKGVAFLIDLAFLKGREKLPGQKIHSLFTY